MNLHQSEGIAGVMTHAGYRIVDALEDADVVLFNGCMVRQKAEEKVYGRIGAVMEEKRRRPVILGVGGCLGQVRGERLLDRFPAIDFVFGSQGHDALPGMIAELEAGGRRRADLRDPIGIDEVPMRRTGTVTGMVTISEGCSNFCSYCVVPYARGPMRSRPSDRILAEVEALVDDGYAEVLLLGQNVNSYGTDRASFGSFVDLLERIASTGIRRIRFTSSHPRDMDPRVFELMAARDNVCNHVHLACQSGSTRVLRAMNRAYAREDFLRIVETGRSIVPRLNVTTDLIVGFPCETEGDFEDTLSLLDEARFGTVFAAKYSPRPLAAASRLADDVSEEVKNERLQCLLDRQRKIALEENERFVGEEVDVLIEGTARNGASYGRADDHRTVLADGWIRAGEMVKMRIGAASAAALSGVAPVLEGTG